MTKCVVAVTKWVIVRICRCGKALWMAESAKAKNVAQVEIPDGMRHQRLVQKSRFSYNPSSEVYKN
jgi:hypothetical protein